MNRRDFLRRLGGAAAAVVLSPMLDLVEILPAPSVVPALSLTPYFMVDRYCPTGPFSFVTTKAVLDAYESMMTREERRRYPIRFAHAS